MVAAADVYGVLSQAHALREQAARHRRRARAVRLAVEWQRGRARTQLDLLERTLDQMSVTLAQAAPALDWESDEGALDDVLVLIG